MKPGDLVRFANPGAQEAAVIMTVLREVSGKDVEDEGWAFCTAGRNSPKLIEVFWPTKGIKHFKADDLVIISDNSSSIEHAKLVALSFAGSCVTMPGGSCED